MKLTVLSYIFLNLPMYRKLEIARDLHIVVETSDSNILITQRIFRKIIELNLIEELEKKI